MEFRSTLIAIVALASAASAACAQAKTAAPAPQGAVVYVTNQNSASVSIIDVATRQEAARVDLQALGFSANAKPHHVVVEPDGSHWYVSLIGDNRVVKFDRANRVVGQAEFEVAGMLALHPTEDLLLVGRSMSAVNPPSSIGVIRRSTMEKLDEVDVLFPRPHAIGVHPSGEIAYTASLAVNQIATVEPAEGDVGIIDVEGPTHTIVQFTFSPDGRTLVATGQMTGRVLVFDVTDPLAPGLTHSVPVEVGAFIPAFSPDGATLWVPNKESNAVTAIDTRTWTVSDVVRGDGLGEPDGAVVSPDGRWVFVSNNHLKGGHHGAEAGAHAVSGTVVVIDAASREIAGVIPVGLNPTGIGIAAR